MATKRQDTQWKRLYTYIYYILYVKYHTCKYAYTPYSPLSPSSWLRARRIKWCERPCACIEFHRVSPRVQSYIVSLFDYVIKTVSLPCTFVQILCSCRILNEIALSMIYLSICDDSEDFRWPLHHGMVKCTSLIFAILSMYYLNFRNVYSIHSPVSDTYLSKLQ